MLSIKELKIENYEKVIEAKDPKVHLHCFIAIHNTELGPSLGGARIKSYSSREEALYDALRLAKAMTYKSAIARDGLGGGKSVILCDENAKNDELLHAFGRVIDSLQGKYIVAEDIGSTLHDMEVIREVTPYVAALLHDKSSGDPSRYTAWGVFKGIQAVATHLWGTTSLRNKKIAIQGLGSVGHKLAEFLYWEGAELIFSEVNASRLQEYALLYGARNVSPEQFCSVECDILAPCALGATVTPDSIKTMRCKAIAGAANNQLLDESCGQLLVDKGILYAPDFIVNAGGIINAAGEFEPGGYHPVACRNKVDYIYDILCDLFARAAKEGKPTSQMADELAEYNLRHGIGKRLQPIVFNPICSKAFI